MNELMIFNSPEFGDIRTVTIENEPWFVGKDVAAALGYRDTSDALKKHVDGEDKGVGELPTPGGIQKTIIINESGLYSLILSSKLKSAKRFKHWITSEVLPSIRKHGGYIAGQETMTDEELLAHALLVANSKIEEQRRKIEADAPKVLFAEAVADSPDCILIGELAKILKQNGVPNMGQNRLFQQLRDDGYLISRRGTDYNMPTQKSMELGLFTISEKPIFTGSGIFIGKTPKVTPRGQQYFINKFLKHNYIAR